MSPLAVLLLAVTVRSLVQRNSLLQNLGKKVNASEPAPRLLWDLDANFREA